MPSRYRIMIGASLAILAFVCHAAVGSDASDGDVSALATSVDANGDDTASIPDFDGDGTIGFGDFVIFAGVFGARQSDEKYDDRLDLDGDGEIGFSDFVIFAQNFGKEVPSPVVAIPDANLRAAIELALGKASRTQITQAEMKTLTTLVAEAADISDLSGLEYATNLTQLVLVLNNITDVSALGSLANLTVLNLFGNNISDVSALGGLTNLTNLDLGHNAITDISALSGLTNLTQLGLLWNVLNDSSINDHIPVLESRGVTVRFDSFHKGDFDIELVLLGDITEDYTEGQKHALQWVSRRWMSIITEDLPDYEFAQDWSGTCGEHSFEIPSGERVDDLRIYVSRFEDADGPAGYGGVSLLRDTRLPIVGCMTFNTKFLYWLVTGLHETGHVLGFSSYVWNEFGYLQDPPNGDRHFNGPLAIAAFDDAGGRDYTGAKVPLEKSYSHWRVPLLEGELMGPGGGGALSAITVQSLADLGYGVDVAQADAYTLPTSTAGKMAAKIASYQPSVSGSVLDLTRHTITPSRDADLYGQGSVWDGPSAILEDDRRTGRLNSLARVWTGYTGFNDNQVKSFPGLPLVPESTLTCGAGLMNEPIYVVDKQGRIVRTIHR